MLKYRILTAIILIPLVLWLIFFMPPFYFALTLAVIVAIGAWEWSSLVRFASTPLSFLYMFAVILGILASPWLPVSVILWVAIGIYLWTFFALIRHQKSGGGAAFALQVSEIKMIMGLILLVAFWLAIVDLKVKYFGATWLLFILLVIWAADTGAYACGRLFGKKKLIPKVSPKKTWEGLAGGILFSLAVAVTFSFLIPLPFSMSQRLLIWLISLMAVLFSVVGDLQISLLKRLVNVKDTGSIFPGHGGMLDRIDSLMAGVIVFDLGLMFLGF